MSAPADLLAGATWECGWSEAERRADPASPDPGSGWLPASVPGTAAAALLEADLDAALLRDPDRHEWWFRTLVEVPDAGPHRLHLGGLATAADVWVDGAHVLRSENMFLAHDLDLDLPAGEVGLLLRFSPLADLLGGRRPRPRWRSARVHDQRLRWVRTTLLGRLPGWAHSPAPVGPWRPVHLVPTPLVEVRRTSLEAVCHDGPVGGTVHLAAEVHGLGEAAPATAEVRVGPVGVEVPLTPVQGHHTVTARVEVPDAARWWPHTHGDQPLHEVTLVLGDETRRLGRVGFRTVRVDRTDGAFTFVVNDVPVFARGTSWAPVDLVGLHVDDARLRAQVELLREGGHSMVRLPGNGVWEDERFHDLLDELGVLLWQDCMLAFLDVPDDPALEESLVAELEQNLGRLQGRPSLALVCGGADTEEQAAYHGVPRSSWASAASTRTIPEVLARVLPGTAYLRATPGDSPLPTATDTGVCHYLSVPAYQRPLEDYRTAGVRFAAECFPLPTPPEPLPLRLQQAVRRGQGPTWEPRLAVHRDSETVPWDMADTMTPYLEEVFGVHDLSLRQQHPDRVDVLRSALSVHLVERGLAEWRRAGSPCAGALTLYGRDPRWGPGLGLVDSLGRPKATWHALRRLSAPVAVLLTDEGFSGLGVHLVNDTAEDVVGRLRVDLYAEGRTLLETDATDVVVPARGGTSVDTTRLFDGFRDLSWAYRFGPPAADVVAVTLTDREDHVVAEAVHLPGGPAREVRSDLGLTGALEEQGDGWALRVRTELFAQWVRVELAGWRAADSWFHLLPGHERVLPLHRDGLLELAAPSGRLHALNSSLSPTLSAPRRP